VLSDAAQNYHPRDAVLSSRSVASQRAELAELMADARIRSHAVAPRF